MSKEHGMEVNYFYNINGLDLWVRVMYVNLIEAAYDCYVRSL